MLTLSYMRESDFVALSSGEGGEAAAAADVERERVLSEEKRKKEAEKAELIRDNSELLKGIGWVEVVSSRKPEMLEIPVAGQAGLDCRKAEAHSGLSSRRWKTL